MLGRAASLVGALALAAAVIAAPTNFAQRSVPIRAGVVLLESQKIASGSTQSANYAPFVWLNLDSNRAVKPAGWNIFNPRANSTVTPAIFERWSEVAAVVGGVVPPAGSNLTKRDAAYWEFRLGTVSDDQLAQYDILLVAAHGNVSLNPLERERLRRFVDQGGVLWIDLTAQSGVNAPLGSSVDPINGFPLAVLPNSTNIGAQGGADFLNPLLSYPFAVTPENLVAMQSNTGLGLKAVDLGDFGLTPLAPIFSSLPGEYTRFVKVAGDNLGPSFLMGQMGDGYVVVTSRGVATTLNRVVVGSGFDSNLRERALEPTADRTAMAAAKLVVNMIHLPSAHGQSFQGSRKTNGSSVNVGAPLLNRFYADLPLDPGAGNYVPPAVFKNLVVTVDDERIYVFNSKPGTDLDGDGIADEGLPDHALGSPADLIWQSAPLDGPVSSPLCIEVSSGTHTGEQILVQQANGTIAAFRAITVDAAGRIVGSESQAPLYTVTPPNGAATFDLGVEGRGPYSPTYHDGLVYVADTINSTIGRLWVFNPGSGNRLSSGDEWVIGKQTAPSLGIVGASPTIGYIPIRDNSGGIDRVAYVATRPNPAVTGPNSTAGISSIWIGAKGEKPVSVQMVGTTSLQVTLRSSQKGLSAYLPGGNNPLGVRLSLIHAGTGDPFTPAQMNALFDGSITQPAPGALRFGLKSGATIDPTLVGVRVDYTIDWGTPTASTAALRGNLFLPDDANKTRRIIGNIALGPDGTFFVTHSNRTAGGSLFAFREEGQGTFGLVYRYDLYSQHTIALNQSQTVTYKETLFDKDPIVVSILPFLNQPLGNLTFMSGPTVRNDTVYVVANGTKLGVVRNAILMAFKTDPGDVEIRTNDIEGGFSILQPDMLRSPDPTAPTVFTTLQGGQYKFDRYRDASKSVVRLTKLMSGNRGPIANAINLSQPVILRRANQPDVLIEPDRTGSNWSPLLHYMVLTGTDSRSPATVLGDTVFLAGASVLPNILSGPPFPPLAPTGVLLGFNASISPNDPFLIADTDRPWLKQLYQVRTTPTFQGNPNWVWPQVSGVTSMDDYRVRVLQTTLGTSPEAFGVVGGNGALFGWSSQGLWGFQRSDFLICDEGRVAKFDPNGNALWSTNATLSGGPSVEVSAAGSARPLVRPVRAQALGLNDVLVVDAGADRIIRMDSAGRELRSIQGFVLDPAGIPEGYQANDPLKLREPRDVLTYASYESNPTGVSNPQPLEYWVHFLIADAGNNRVVELVDRYAVDPTTRTITGAVNFTDASGGTQPAFGVLRWHTPAAVSSKKYRYTALARQYKTDGANSRHVYAAAIGGTMPTKVDLGMDAPNTVTPGSDVRESRDGNGGIVFFDGPNTEIINEVLVPALAANILWDPNTGTFSSQAVPARKKVLTNLNSVTMRNLYLDVDGNGPASHTAILFTDSSGVYEIVKIGAEWRVVWMLPRNVYRVMRRNASNVPTGQNPLDFRPMYARRLDSGEILVVNGYFGRKANGEAFEGEILQLFGDLDPAVFGTGFEFSQPNLGFNSLSIRFELPPIQGTRGLTMPVFADRN